MYTTCLCFLMVFSWAPLTTVLPAFPKKMFRRGTALRTWDAGLVARLAIGPHLERRRCWVIVTIDRYRCNYRCYGT